MDFLVLIAVVIAVYWQSRQGRGETQTFAFGAKAKPIPERLRQVWWMRQIDRIGLVLLGRRRRDPAAGRHPAVAAPAVHVDPGLRPLRPLAHRAHGLGRPAVARPDGLRRRRCAADRGVHPRDQLSTSAGATPACSKAGIEPLRFGPAVFFAVLITAGLAVLIGAGALRVRGLYLAVVTFAFALAAAQYLYDRPDPERRLHATRCRCDAPTSSASTSRRSASFYYVVLGVLGGRGGRRRPVAGERRGPHHDRGARQPGHRGRVHGVDHPDEAPGLRPRRRPRRPRRRAPRRRTSSRCPSDRYFTVADSLLRGVHRGDRRAGSVAGTVLGAIWVIGLPAFFPDNDLVPLLTSSIGLLVLLLYFPGGLIQIGLRPAPGHPRAGRSGASARHRPSSATPSRPARRRSGRPLPDGVPALRTEDVVVRFGGNLAVDHVSLEVARRRGRRPDRHERRRQVDPDERDRRLRPVVRDGRAARHVDHGEVGGGSRPARARPQLPVRHAVPRAHRARHRARRPRGPGPHRHALDRPVLARLPSSGSGPAGPRPRSSSTSSGSGATPTPTSVTSPPAPGASSSWPGLLALDARVPLPRRAHRRRRPARDRGVRPADPRGAPRAGRLDAGHRARHAADHEHQRPRVLPRGRAGSSPRARPTRCGTTRRWSPATSAPTSGPSPAAARSPTSPTSRRWCWARSDRIPPDSA